MSAIRPPLRASGSSPDLVMPILSPSSSTVLELEEDPLGKALFDAIISKHEASVDATAKSITCCDIPGQGRGLFATASIQSGQALVSVPVEEAITPSKAAQLSSLSSVLADHPALPDWSLLALWLVELLANPQKFTELHSNYASVLPKSTGSVLEWTEDELSLLKGSYLYVIGSEIRNAAETSWKELEPIIQHAEHAGLVPEGIFTAATLRHAFALLLSRLIRLDGLENARNGTNSTEVLCPWADLVNHSSNCTSFIQYVQKTKSVILSSDRTYSPGEQVYACYGQKTSGELLLSYGFCPEEGSNPFDGCLLCIDLSDEKKVPGSKLKRTVVEAHQGESKRMFPLRMGAVPEGLLQFAAFAAAPVDNEIAAQRLFDGLLLNSAGSMGPEYLQLGYKSVSKLCKDALAGYKMPLESAKAELEKLSSFKNGGKYDAAMARRADILRVLIYEQKVLARTSFLMKQQLKK